MPPYKDPDKQKETVKRLKEKWLGRVAVNFLPGEEQLYKAFRECGGGTKYVKTALREKLIQDGYLHDE